MNRALWVWAMVGASALGLGVLAEAMAGGRTRNEPGPQLTVHPKASYYRKRGTQVRGYITRRGGYSYTYADSINTYGNSRTLYGGTWFYRDPMLDRQTSSGPFDHGFFFDSGVTPRGGESPYMN